MGIESSLWNLKAEASEKGRLNGGRRLESHHIALEARTLRQRLGASLLIRETMDGHCGSVCFDQSLPYG